MNESELKVALEELKQTPHKLNFVYALIANNFNVSDALKQIGRSKGWFYDQANTTVEEREYLIQLAKEYHAATKFRAMEIIESAVPHAAEVLVKLLDSRDERVKQSATTQVLDRGIGKTSEKIDVTSGGEVIKINIGLTTSDEEL